MFCIICKMGVQKALLLFLFVKITTVICNGRSHTEKYFVKEKNVWCIKCDIGEYVAGYCTANYSTSTCKPCAENEYVSDGGATSCADCTDCKRQDDKTVEYIKCTKSENTVCVCPQGQIFKDGYCQQCPENHVVERTESDVDGKCVKCESGNFYDKKTERCAPCSSCGEDEVIVDVCGDDRDVQCEAKGLSPAEIAGIVIGVLLGVLVIGVIIVVSVYQYRKKKREPLSTKPENPENRPKWIEPLITILIQDLQDYHSCFHKLPDLKEINCRTRLGQLDNQYHWNAKAVISHFVYEYHAAATDDVGPQAFATALEEDGLNSTVETMKAHPILAEYLNVVEDRQDPDTMPLIRTHQSTSQQTQLSSNNTANVATSIDDQEKKYLPTDIRLVDDEEKKYQPTDIHEP